VLTGFIWLRIRSKIAGCYEHYYKTIVPFWDLTPCNLVVGEPAASILRVYEEDSVCTRLHRYRIAEDTAAPACCCNCCSQWTAVATSSTLVQHSRHSPTFRRNALSPGSNGKLGKQPAFLTLRRWRRRQYIPPKRPWTYTGLHGVTSQTIALYIVTAVRSSSPSYFTTFKLACTVDLQRH
jgi:hypothetical protein